VGCVVVLIAVCSVSLGVMILVVLYMLCLISGLWCCSASACKL